MGYKYAHDAYGLLSWKEIVQPTIDLCKRGNLVTPFLARLLKSQEGNILASPTLR